MRQPEKERDHVEDIGIDEMIILKCILKTLDGTACTGLWLRIRTSGAIL